MDNTAGSCSESASLAAIVAVCMMLVGLVVVELLMRLTLQGIFGHLQGFALRYVGWALLPVCAIAIRRTKPLGRSAIAVTLGALALLYGTITMTRGLWVWAGTFDAYWLSRATWLVPSILGCAVGLCLWRLPIAASDVGLKTAMVWLGALLGATVAEWWGSRIYTDVIDSVYAPTRFVVMAGVFMVLVVGVVIDRRAV